MKKISLSIVLIFVMSVCTLSGCKKTSGIPDGVIEDNEENASEETSEEQERYTFGYTCSDISNPYYESLEMSMKTIIDEMGNELQIYDASGDSVTQLEQIQQMIEEEVDAVFLCPADREAIQPGIDALNEADIPIINVDTEVKDIEHVTAYVGSNNKNAGIVCGEDLKRKKNTGGSIIVLECQSMNSIIDRITGFEEAIAGCGFEVIERVDAQGDRGNARKSIKRLLEQNDKVDAIMCGNDQMALGALTAVNASGRTDILIYGVDGSPGAKKQIAKGTSPLIGTAAQSPINIGKTAVETAMAILNNDDYEKITYEDTFLIDSSNVELYGTDGWQ